MRIALIGAAASAALVSASAIAIAQMPGGAEPPGKMQAPGAQSPGSQGPGAQGPASRPGSGKGETQRAPDGGSGKGTRESQGASPGKDRSKASEGQPERGQPKASERQPEKSQPKASERQPEKKEPKASERQPDKAQPKASERQPDRNQKSTEGPKDSKQGGRVRVTEQQRTSVRDHLVKEGKFQKTNINIRVNVGTRVPRTVRLLPLPIAIIDLAPSYRGYDYIVLEDETICIVDPGSYEVVDVIGVGSHRAEAPRGQRLSLSQEQMRFVASAVPREPKSDVRVRLALGAEVPRNVELLAFPRDVVSQLPELGGYRYIVAENDVVIVDPRERGVVLVITD
jgi:uncharacterized protein DUF1236